MSRWYGRIASRRAASVDGAHRQSMYSRVTKTAVNGRNVSEQESENDCDDQLQRGVGTDGRTDQKEDSDAVGTIGPGCWNCSRPSVAALNAATMAPNSVAVSVVFVAASEGKCERDTWQTKLMTTNVSRDAFPRSSRSLRFSTSRRPPPIFRKASMPATGQRA
jgi:hypothetical protein